MIDAKPTVDVIEEFLPPNDVPSGGSMQTHFQQTPNDEIDLEMLNNHMQFECVRIETNERFLLFFKLHLNFAGRI